MLGMNLSNLLNSQIPTALPFMLAKREFSVVREIEPHLVN